MSGEEVVSMASVRYIRRQAKGIEDRILGWNKGSSESWWIIRCQYTVHATRRGLDSRHDSYNRGHVLVKESFKSEAIARLQRLSQSGVSADGSLKE
jgi:hypothetical protein